MVLGHAKYVRKYTNTHVIVFDLSHWRSKRPDSKINSP